MQVDKNKYKEANALVQKSCHKLTETWWKCTAFKEKQQTN